MPRTHHHRRHWRVTVLIALLIAGAAAAPGVASAATPAGLIQPDKDPFYGVPAGVDAATNGQVLESRPVVANVLGVPMPAKAWQVKYRTIDQHGAPSAFITTVIVPNAPWTSGGPRPLVSYQTAEDGLGLKCAPSYAMRAGVLAGGGNGAEAALVLLAVQRGFAVSVPDYQGPRSEFTGADGTAHGVLDGIRAARNFGPAVIDPHGPVGLMGYSGGAMASDWALQAQPSYAPELTLAGAALGGVVTDLYATFMKFNDSITSGAIVMVLGGLDRSYPDLNITRFLNSAGRNAIIASRSDCLLDAVVRHPAATMATWGSTRDTAGDPAFTAAIGRPSPLTYPGTPAAPILFYHSVIDEFAPIDSMHKLADRFCRDGVTVARHESVAGEHGVYAVTGAPTALAYLADRFAGKPAPDDC